MRPFLRNTWYAAAWSGELAKQPIARTMLGQKLVLYRRADGAAVALGDVCPHRFAPLHQGNVIGDAIECPYHGLRFGPAGTCTHNPHGGAVPATARVPAWPVAEAHGLIWVWPGDPARSGATPVPDFGHLTSPDYRTIPGSYVTEAHYEIFTDNVMDLTHTQFLHKDLQGAAVFLQAERRVAIEGQTVRMTYRCPVGRAPPLSGRSLPDPDMPVRLSVELRWDAPSLIRLTAITDPVDGSCPPLVHVGTHILTPETDSRTRYLYAASRTYLRDDESVDEAMREWHRRGFGEQDKPMIEAVQANMGDADLLDLDPVLLGTDSGLIQVRRLLRRLIAAEGAAEAT